MRYVVGWNWPGYMPDDTTELESWSDAVSAMISVLEQDMEERDCPDYLAVTYKSVLQSLKQTDLDESTLREEKGNNFASWGITIAGRVYFILRDDLQPTDFEELSSNDRKDRT